MNWSKWFLFSKRERNGMIAIFIFIPIAYSFPYWCRILQGPDDVISSVEQVNDYLHNRKLKEELVLNSDSLNEHSNQYNDEGGYKLNTSGSNIKKGFITNSKKEPFKQYSYKQNNYKKDYTAQFKQPYKSTKNIPLRSIDINTASAELLQQLPGIGPVISARIINFREKIGGFKNIEQLGKTYGLSDSLFTVIMPFLVMHPIEGREGA